MKPPGPVRIELLGPLRVVLEGREAVRFPTRKVEALFGMIALAGERGIGRDVAAALLWSRSPEGQARANLRQALSGMRKSLGTAAEIVTASSDILMLDRSRVVTDTAVLIEGSTAALLDDHDWLIGRGALLDGLDLREPPFEDWLSLERQRWQHLLCGRLAEASEARLRDGPPGIALALARRLVSLDDLNEASHRLVMQAMLAAGEEGAALRHFETLRLKLRDELGIAPGEATASIATAIRAGSARPASPPPEPPQPEPRTEPPPVQSAPLLVPSTVLPQDGHTELRMVMVLAGRVISPDAGGHDPGDPRTEAAVLDRRSRIASTVGAHGGILVQNTGTGFRAIFGAKIARSNDAERAVSCGLSLLGVGREGSEPAWRLVAAAGRVLVEVAPDGTLGFAGDPLDRAEDLLSAVRDMSFVSDPMIRDATQREFSFESTGNPSVWRVGARVAAERRPVLTAFVGRDSEFARIEAVLVEVAACGQAEVVVLRGEAGIGKTRLSEEIAALAQGIGFRVISVSALDFGAGKGDGLVAGMTRALGAAPQEAATVLDAAILADLTARELDPTEREILSTLDPAGRSAERSRLMVGMVAEAAGQSPLLLVLEDLHWAATDAVALLADVAAAARDLPLAMVLTTRPQEDPVNSGWRRRCSGARISTIDLAPLRDDAARRLISGLGELAPDLVENCLERAQGNPLFLEHLARSAPRLRGGQLPLSVVSVVQEELDQLSAATRQTLRAAAVLGQVFAADALSAVVGVARADTEDLLATGLVIHRGDRLGFVHALVRDGVHGSIPAADRAELHRRAAAWFEERNPVIHAEHLDLAGDPGAARAYLAAATAERGAGRPEDALGLVEQAAALAEDDETAQGVRLLKGHLLADLERFDEAILTFSDVSARDARTLCAARLGEAECLMRLDRHDEALACLEKAEPLATESAEIRNLAVIPYVRSTILFAQGASAQSVENARIAQRLARESGDRLLEARALSAMADAEQACGRFRSAERAFKTCVAISEELGLRRYALVNRKMCADLRFYDAEFGVARAMLEEIRAEARALGVRRAEMLAEHMLAYVDCAEAKYDDALVRAGRGRELVEELGAQRFMMNNACYTAMALTGLGRSAEAVERLAQAEATAAALNVTWVMPWVLAQRALCEASPRDARSSLERAEALIRSGAGSYPLDCYRPAIDAAIGIGDWNRVRSYADELTRFFSEERVGLADFLIRRARLIAAANLGDVDPVGLVELINETRRIGYLEALPAIEAALARNPGADAR